MVERLFLAVPRGCLQFVIVVFPDHTHYFCPLLLASKLQDFANWLKDYQKIQHVYISEIFTRPSPRNCSAGIYTMHQLFRNLARGVLCKTLETPAHF